LQDAGPRERGDAEPDVIGLGEQVEAEHGMTAAEYRLAETLIRLGDATELAERFGMSADFVRRIQAELNAKTELDAEREIIGFGEPDERP
jgi:hypothetical protein